MNGYDEAWKASLIFASKGNLIIRLISFNITFLHLNYRDSYADQLRGNDYTKTSLRFASSLENVV